MYKPRYLSGGFANDIRNSCEKKIHRIRFYKQTEQFSVFYCRFDFRRDVGAGNECFQQGILPFHFLKCIPPTQFRQSQVQDNKIDLLAMTPMQCHRLNSVLGAQNSVSLSLKQTPHILELLGFIFHEKDHFTAHGLSFPLGRTIQFRRETFQLTAVLPPPPVSGIGCPINIVKNFDYLFVNSKTVRTSPLSETVISWLLTPASSCQ